MLYVAAVRGDRLGHALVTATLSHPRDPADFVLADHSILIYSAHSASVDREVASHGGVYAPT